MFLYGELSISVFTNGIFLINICFCVWKNWGLHLCVKHIPFPAPGNHRSHTGNSYKRDAIFPPSRSSTMNLLSSILGILPTPGLWDQI